AFRLVQQLRARGKDLRQFVKDATAHMRDLMVLASVSDAGDMVAALADEREAMTQQARRLGLPVILEALQILVRTDGEMRWSPNGQLILETALVRLAHLSRGGVPMPAQPAAATAAASTSAPARTAVTPPTPVASAEPVQPVPPVRPVSPPPAVPPPGREAV